MAVVTFPSPHSAGQEALILSGSRDVVLAGRRFGKTFAGSQRLTFRACETEGEFWWVGLNWRSASMAEAWTNLQGYHKKIWDTVGLDYRKRKSLIHNVLTLPNGSLIKMRTAENPESLSGASVSGAVFDEFTMARESVWTEHLAPCLITTNGWMMFIGVPKGNNWGAKLWRSAKKTEGWRQWHFTTLDNPRVKPSDFESIKNVMPELMQQQELYAEILAGRGTVFRNIQECTGAAWTETPIPGHTYVAGLDWGLKNDYTVLTVIDTTTNEVVFLDRFNQIDYQFQMERVKKSHSVFDFATILAEGNSMGGPLCSQLIRDGLPIREYYMNQHTKRDVIERLIVSLEQNEIKLPAEEWLIDELESFEVKLSALGTPQYAAPEGTNNHDDGVISLALANFATSRRISI